MRTRLQSSCARCNPLVQHSNEITLRGYKSPTMYVNGSHESDHLGRGELSIASQLLSIKSAYLGLSVCRVLLFCVGVVHDRADVDAELTDLV